MPFRRFSLGEYSPTRYTTDLGYLVQPSDFIPGPTKKVIIGFHGHGANAWQYGLPPLDLHVNALVAAGYSVYGIDQARVNSWGDSDAMRAIDDAYTYVTTTLGYNTKVGLMGWSMGGLTALNWLKRNPTKTACAYIWNPATDLRFFRDTQAVYPVPYSVGGATGSQANATYASEINSNFAPATTAVGAYTIPAAGGTGITITTAGFSIGNVFADQNNSAQGGPPWAYVGGVAFYYQSKTDNTLVGCTSATASTIAVANGQAITGQFNGQTQASQPWQEAAFIGSLGVPIRVVQASDDTTVPPGMNANDATGFVGRAASANVTLRTPSPTGGHVNSISNVPTSEVVAFYQANL